MEGGGDPPDLALICSSGVSDALCAVTSRPCRTSRTRERNLRTAPIRSVWGRYTGKGTPKKGDSSGCNWAAYGLFGIPAEHDIVIVAPGDQVDVYPFADGEQEADNG